MKSPQLYAPQPVTKVFEDEELFLDHEPIELLETTEEYISAIFSQKEIFHDL